MANIYKAKGNLYADARDVIYDNEITDEAEIQQLMGAFLFKTANDMNINITKYP